MSSPPKRPAAVAAHCTQSTAVDDRPERREPSQKRYTPRHLGRVRAMKTPVYNSPRPEAGTYLPGAFETQSQPTLTRAGEKCDGRQGRARRPRSIRIRRPPGRPGVRLNLARRIANPIRFPFNGFTYFLTLFSKCFSSFPHGTCSLSVSCQYLALDGVYHPFWAAFPNNPTLGKRIVSGRLRHRRGCHPL